MQKDRRRKRLEITRRRFESLLIACHLPVGNDVPVPGRVRIFRT